MSYRDHEFERGQGGMSHGNGYRGQSSRQDRFADEGRYGGWDNEGQYASGEQGSRGQERYGQVGYGQEYGRQPTNWESGQYGSQQFGQGGGDQNRMGGRGYRGEDQFQSDRGYGGSMGQYGTQDVAQRSFQSAGGWLPNAQQGWGDQGRTRGGSWDQNQDWEQGPSGRGHWGQGNREAEMQYQRQSRQGAGGQAIGIQGRAGGGGGASSYEEVWLIPGPHSGRGPRGYQRNDQRIEEDICERLTHHGQIDAEDIEVSVKQGEVTLTGTVESRQAKRMAEDLLDSVSGVKDVHNQLRVKQRESRSDQDRITGQTQLGDGQGSSGASRGQSRNQSRRNETAEVGASNS